MTHLEDSFYNEFPNASLNDVSNFVLALKSWYFIIRFAIIHNTILPSKFLKYFANNNMWLEFVLTSNIFKYPLEQVRNFIVFIYEVTNNLYINKILIILFFNFRFLIMFYNSRTKISVNIY